MSMKLTRAVYADLIIQDIAQLMRHMPDTLERQHIEDVLNNSIECYYGDNSRADRITLILDKREPELLERIEFEVNANKECNARIKELEAELEQCLDCCKRVGELEAELQSYKLMDGNNLNDKYWLMPKKKLIKRLLVQATQIVNTEAERDRLREALQAILDGEANLGWQPCAFIAKEALEETT